MTAPLPDQITYRDPSGKVQWRVTPEGKLRGPVVRRFYAATFAVAAAGAALGGVLSRVG